MQYSDVTTALTAGWIIGNIQLPSFFDKNLIYNLLYPHRLFIQVYDAMPIQEVSQADVFSRKQMAKIHGVYSSYPDCEKALKETTRSITAHAGWRLGGESKIIKKGSAFVFILSWFERAFLRGGEW